MSNWRRVACFAAISGAMAVSGVARPADWTQWGGRSGRNMISEEKNLPASFSPGKKRPSGAGIDPKTTENVKWTARLGTFAYGNPTVSNGRVFVGTDDLTLDADARFQRTRGGMVKCFEEATGKLLWQLVVPKRNRLPEKAHFGHQHLGTCSSPAVLGDRVFVVTSASDIVCLDARGLADGNDGSFQDEARYMVGPGKRPVELKSTDADILWRFDVIDQCGVVPHDAASCSALLHDGLVYVGTSNGVDQPHTSVVAPDGPSLIVLDQETGRLVATDNERIGHRLFHAQWSPPSLGKVNGRALIFFAGGDGICYAFEAVDGIAAISKEPVSLRKVWSYDCNPPDYKFRDGKPIPYYDGDKRKRRGNKNDGKYVGPSQIIATPVFHNNRVYVATGQDPAHGRGRAWLHCIDATKTGDITSTGKVWSYDGIERSISTVAISDGLLYVPDFAGFFHCLDADDGTVRWVHAMNADTWGSPLVADGKIYLGTKRDLWVFRAGTAGKAEVLSRIPLGSAVYTTPIVANGVLYIASQRYLWAVQSEPGQPEPGQPQPGQPQ